jgi:hypothetical protein
MKKKISTLLYWFCLFVIISCNKNTTDPNQNPINPTPPPKSLILQAIETDSGIVLSWRKINFTDDVVKNFNLLRGKDANFSLIVSPWTGDYDWTVRDSSLIDKAPPFSEKIYYKVIANLKSGEQVASNVVELSSESSVFVKGYKAVQSHIDTANNVVYLADAFTSKIRSVNYSTKESVESSIETEMFNGGALLSVANGNAKELYALTRVYGKLNIFDSKTLQLKKAIDARSPNLVTQNGLVYLSYYPNLSIMRISDNSIIQTTNYYPWAGDMTLLLVPNSNKLLGISVSAPNKVREFTLKTDGTVLSHKDLTPPSSGNDEIYGFTVNTHPINGTLISGFKGSIYNSANLSFQNSLNLSFNPGVTPIYAFSPDGKYLAVSTNNMVSPVVIYNVPSLTKKYSFEVPDCIVQNLSWKEKAVIVVANTNTGLNSYLHGTVVIKRKIPN